MEPIQKKSAVDLAVEKLTEYIRGDSLAIGDKLPAEITLCKELNISRTTIREAYRVLQSLGYLDIQTGKGAFVQDKQQNFIAEATDWITSHRVQMNDYLYVRMALDPLAAQLAATCATQKDVDDLCMLHKAFVQSVRDGDNEAMAELDAKYHERIVEITHNELLLALVQIVNHYFKLLRRTSFRFEEHANHAVAPHAQIIEAIGEGNAQKAAQASVEHMRLAFADLCDIQPELWTHL